MDSLTSVLSAAVALIAVYMMLFTGPALAVLGAKRSLSVESAIPRGFSFLCAFLAVLFMFLGAVVASMGVFSVGITLIVVGDAFGVLSWLLSRLGEAIDGCHGVNDDGDFRGECRQ